MSLRKQGDPEALKERARNLALKGFNGIQMVIVNIASGSNPKEANLEVYFYNSNKIKDILEGHAPPDSIFTILGGHRILGGQGSGQIKVTFISAGGTDNVLKLTVSPIGDYSTYTLNINYVMIDPIFSDIEFKFRPGCFTTECAPEWDPGKGPLLEPTIDYLAKDFDSFRHTMITAMMQRVPNWQPSSEADLDQVLLELISATGDELSDYQDRVMNEAYLGTARKRISLARHGRLMDYHIHQGNQASTCIAIKLKEGNSKIVLNSGLDWTSRFAVSTENNIKEAPSTLFGTRDVVELHPLLNSLDLYTWQDTHHVLQADSTQADLKFSDKQSANTIRDLIREGKVTHLLIQQWLDPETGRAIGRDPNMRQLLQLLKGINGAATMQDPVTQQWFLRVRWEEKDRLKHNYCFVTQTDNRRAEGVSQFHGNLVQAYFGRTVEEIFKDVESPISNTNDKISPIERTSWGATCRLSHSNLLYKNTTPGGEIPPKSTLMIEVKTDVLPPHPEEKVWLSPKEEITLIHSDDDDENFVVETDEESKSLIRFGNGINGKMLPQNVKVYCYYQIGIGSDGNIGSDKLTKFDEKSFPDIESCWNPFAVTDGRNREPLEEIIRRVPESYKFRQQRAITLQDYINLVERIEGVSRASASYMWTGSWRTVRISIDPEGTTELTDDLKKIIASRLDAARLIGEDFEIRLARYVPLEIHVSFCVHKDYWPNDVRSEVEREFSNGYTADGRLGFFHPDHWTFGQELRASQIIGRLLRVQGVDYVIKVDMKRWDQVTPASADKITVQNGEIILVENSPDHMERGFMDFEIKGGRGLC